MHSQKQVFVGFLLGILMGYIWFHIYKFIVQSHNSGQLLLDIIETLKLFYGPINELNLDFLNQTVELTFPKR